MKNYTHHFDNILHIIGSHISSITIMIIFVLMIKYNMFYVKQIINNQYYNISIIEKKYKSLSKIYLYNKDSNLLLISKYRKQAQKNLENQKITQEIKYSKILDITQSIYRNNQIMFKYDIKNATQEYLSIKLNDLILKNYKLFIMQIFA